MSVAAGGNQVLIVAGGLSVAGKLDLNDNDMIFEYTGLPQLGTIQPMINSARNGGLWDGNGITSTTAKNNAAHNTTLGAMEATDYKSLGNVTFDSQPIDNSAVLIKYTWYGDSNFNGKVDGADYSQLDAKFNQEVSTMTNIGGWFNGDFDGNGKIDGADYSLIDGAFNSQDGTILRPVLPPGKAGKITTR